MSKRRQNCGIQPDWAGPSGPASPPGPVRFFLALCILVAPPPAASSEVWLSGFDPLVRSAVEPGVANDYLDVFAQDAAWPQAAAKVSVYKIAGSLALSGPEAQLQMIFADLRRRHISLGLEIMPMTGRADCGQKIEGYAPPGDVVRTVERIHRLGGDLQYVAMDEPLWNGHQFSGSNACRTPISAIAADVAANVSAIKRIFPAVRVGDIEQIGRNEPPDLVDQVMQWTNAYQQAVGEPLAFVHFDVVWTGPWRQQLTSLAGRLRAAGLKFGIIYNGDPSDQTDLAWTGHAEQRFAEIEANPALVPDQAILQTWMVHPSRMLPETQPGTLTWLVNRYAATKVQLIMRRSGERLEGQLVDNAYRPVRGATVSLTAAQTGESGAPAIHKPSGKVPERAAEAVFALRVNAECECSGTANVAIGPMLYKEERTGQSTQRSFRSVGGRDSAGGFTHIQALPGDAITQNTTQFAVTAGAPFSLQVPMRTNLASARSGYVALIFLDGSGKEVQRLRLTFQPVEQPIGTAITDTTGHFSLAPKAETMHSSVGFRADFPGDGSHRTASVAIAP